MSSSKLVGIINITPDSFSDGGKFRGISDIETLIAEGADVIDIGAESTRPGATLISPELEWKRLAPLFAALDDSLMSRAIFSLDTRHAETAKRALEKGFHWINDVAGFSDPRMIDAVKKSDCRLVVMHSLTVPPDKNIVWPETTDSIAELKYFAEEKTRLLSVAEIAPGRLIFDPGLGFGKTPAQSRAIIARAHELDEHVWLFGHSRKSFLGRDEKATLAASRQLSDAGVGYLRIHNVKLHREQL